MGGLEVSNINSTWRTVAILDFPQNAIPQQPVEVHLFMRIGRNINSYIQLKNGHMTAWHGGSRRLKLDIKNSLDI